MHRTFKLLILTITLIPSTLFAQKANQEEIDLLVDRHNFWRSDVGLGKISYSEEMAKVANKWAISLKKQDCAFKHSGNDHGENLFKGTLGYYTAGDAVDAWGEEKSDYNYDSNKCKRGKMCGHYTQIVWKTTTEFGCAKNICDGNVTWVCSYNPPGNWVGEKPY